MKYNFPNKHQVKNAQRLAMSLLLVASLFTFVTPMASASHGATVVFNAGTYNYDAAAHITVTDPTAAGAGTVEVSITSTSDPVVGILLTLTENPPGSGIFDNDIDPGPGVIATLLFMDGNNKFPLDTATTISVDDPLSNISPAPDISTAFVTTSGGGFTTIDLTETGDDTNIFEGTFTFSATGITPSSTSFPITAGETFSIGFACDDTSNGQITPIPAGSLLGAIRADDGDTITVTYLDATHTDTAILGATGGCGGGGGGLIISSVPVLALLGIGGGGGHDKTPPSLTRPISSGFHFDPFEPIAPTQILAGAPQAPLIIGENGYNLHGYFSVLDKKNTLQTGQFTAISLAFEEASEVSHVAMYLVDEGKDEHSDRDPALIFDNGNIIKVDPQGIFGDDIQLSTSKQGTKSIFNFGMSFDKPTNKNLIIVAWDDKRNSATTKVFNALEVVGNEIPDQAAHFLPIEEHGEFDFIKDDNGQYVLSQPTEIQTVTPDSPKTIVYPQFIGRLERHDDGFQQAIAQEYIKAQTIAQSIIGNPFTAPDDRPTHGKFFYPSKVGKLDREKEDTLKDAMINEHVKTTKIFSKLYHTNHLED